MEMRSSHRRLATTNHKRLHLRRSGEFAQSQRPIFTSVPITSTSPRMTSRKLATRTFCPKTFWRSSSSFLTFVHRSVFHSCSAFADDSWNVFFIKSQHYYVFICCFSHAAFLVACFVFCSCCGTCNKYRDIVNIVKSYHISLCCC